MMGTWGSALGCGGETLGLGRDGPGYATPETIAGEADAVPGTPTVIASHQYGAYDVAVDDTRVYWRTVGTPPTDFAHETCVVRSCMKDNCAGTVVTYTSGGATPCTKTRGVLAVNRTHVYWLSGSEWSTGQILACPIEGCLGPPQAIVESGAFLFAVDDTHIYWKASDATLKQCPFDGCAGEPTIMTLLGNGSSTHSAPVLDATDVYWTDGASSRAIMAIPKDKSGPVRTIASGIPVSYSLAVDTGSVYWVENWPQVPEGEGIVKRCPKTGCSGEPTIVASHQGNPDALQATGDDAAWVTSGSLFRSFPNGAWGEVRQCPIAGCGAETGILVGQRGIVWTAIDATHAYWTSAEQISIRGQHYVDGTVQRIRRRR